MSLQDNKSIVRRFVQLGEAGDLAGAGGLLDPNSRFHIPGSPQPLDFAAYAQMGQAMLTAFSGGASEFHEQLAEGDLVATRGTYRAIHSGEFQGVPATGRELVMPWISLDRLQNGRIVEHHVSWDNLSIMQQLGLAPSQS